MDVTRMGTAPRSGEQREGMSADVRMRAGVHTRLHTRTLTCVGSVMVALVAVLVSAPVASAQQEQPIRIQKQQIERGLSGTRAVTAKGAAVKVSVGSSKGWLGLLFQQDDDQRSYAIVQSVDPGSPALRAGMQPGDTVLSLNGTNVQAVLADTARGLKPGTKVAVKFRRGGVRDVTIVAAPQPTFFTYAQTAAPASRNEVMMVLEAMVPPVGTGVFTVCNDFTVAGAKVMAVNPDLAKALKTKGDGVLVLVVAPGTPAMEAGLKSGDVIVSADGQSMGAPVALLKAMREAEDGGDGKKLLLNVIRDGKGRKVTFRW